MNLGDLEGIGPARLEALNAVGIVSLRDLLFTLPLRYEDHISVFPCDTRQTGNILVEGVIQDPLKASFFHGISRVTGILQDTTGKLPMIWYNEPWIAKQIQIGKPIRLYGQLSIKGNRRMIMNPSIVTDSGWIPVYRTIKKIPQRSFRKLIQSALKHLPEICQESLPDSFRKKNNLCKLDFAIKEVHFPTGKEELEAARRRLSFEKILVYLLYVSVSGKARHLSMPFKTNIKQQQFYWASLPFEPTEAQRRVLSEIAADMNGVQAMARLVQGDVGSGKTAVAFGAICLANMSGFQSSMMAPTEILASQHFENAKQILEPLGIRCRLITGSTKAKERNAILSELAEGTCCALFGTHAVFSLDIKYKRLGLVITDEQHRFGVSQRTALERKGMTEGNHFPHVLVMSATPIPRSLALILYGDLDISIINELPSGRIPVKTRLVPESKREDMYRFLRNEIQKGRQAYIVCPAVDDSESTEELHSVKTVFESLQHSSLQGIRMAMTWGGQKSEDKEEILRRFSAQEYDILISTTVIEVGINNPNASIMIIENAERFGLSQLHQLRGRVGRGTTESWCFLLSESSAKLEILCKTNDGFEISKKDLEFRGPGDLIGTQQSGNAVNTLLNADAFLLEEVSNVIRQLKQDPDERDTLSGLEKYSRSFFEQQGHEIALS